MQLVAARGNVCFFFLHKITLKIPNPHPIANIRKLLGYTKGTPDLLVFQPNADPLAVEFKTGVSFFSLKSTHFL